MKYFCFVLFLFSFIYFTSTNTLAREEHYFDLNINNGLMSNHVHNVIMDNYGYFVTPTRAACYNSYDLKIFNMPKALPYENIRELLKSRKGRISLGYIEIPYINEEYPLTGTVVNIQIKTL